MFTREYTAYWQRRIYSPQLCDLTSFDGKYPILGSWVIGQQAADMGIRESDTRITNNTNCFIPHLIDEIRKTD